MPRDIARYEFRLSAGLFAYESNAARRLTAGDDFTSSESSEITGMSFRMSSAAMSPPIPLVLTRIPISEFRAPVPFSLRTSRIMACSWVSESASLSQKSTSTLPEAGSFAFTSCDTSAYILETVSSPVMASRHPAA